MVIFNVNAQTQNSTLDYNNTSVVIQNGGDFFWDLSSAKHVVPKSTSGTTKSTIFSGAVWIGAEEEDGSVHLSAMTYRQRGQDFWPGPSSLDTAAARSKYDKIFEVTAAQIQAHIQNSSNPISAILNWPGNGDTTKGVPYQLAPFVDINKNGKYEPIFGDYPKIKGTAATYCIYTDHGIHTESGGVPLGVDVHQLFYQDVATGFEEVNLASFTVVNRSDTNYTKFKFGIYVDFDLGNYADDYVGCDSATNMIYAYNGDADDEGVLGYGINPPAQNMMFLNTRLGSALYYNNDFNPVSGNPRNAQDYYNYLSAKWMTGNDMNYGGNGITGGMGKTNYMFSGDPVANTGWTEVQAGNVPSDRRMLAVAKETSLAKGEVKCFDMAFVYGRTSNGGNLASISEMKNKAAQVQSAYDADYYQWKTKDCALSAAAGTSTLGISTSDFEHKKINLYPNPTHGVVTVVLPKDTDFNVFNAHGAELQNVKISETQVDLSEYSSGIYFIKSNFGTFRIIKQ